MVRRYTEEEKDKYLKMYMDGMAVREIVEKYDVTKSPLSKWITERGLAKVRRLTDEDANSLEEEIV